MASLSRVVSIPRRLGEVTVNEINRLTGVYRLYACGGGGGGGGTYVQPPTYYGTPGRAALPPSHDRFIAPPLVISGGGGGGVGTGLADGETGHALIAEDARGVTSSSVGGDGGERAISARYPSPSASSNKYVKHFVRFTVEITTNEPLQPYYTTDIGRGGGSTGQGSSGGIVTAFRIG